VFCVSETHLDSFDIVDINGYTFLSKHRTQSYRRKSGGIGIYVRDEISPFVEILQNNSEYILWVSISKELTKQDENTILGSIYLPPESSRFFNEDHYRDFENEISQYCNIYKYVYLAGDTNSRVGTLRDFIYSDSHINEIFNIDLDLQNQLDKYTILNNLSIPLNRNSKDCRTNTQGFRLIDICKNNNLFLFNGRLFKDKNTGSYTFRDKSVIDYVCSTADCLEYVTHFEILETDSLFSDGHYALSWNVKTHSYPYKTGSQANKKGRPAWNPEKTQTFINNIDIDQLEILKSQLFTYPQSQLTINNLTRDLETIFRNAGAATFTDKTFNYKRSFPNNKPWFGPKCHAARQNYHEAKEVYNKYRNNDNKVRLRNASKQYKRTMNFYIKLNKQISAEQLRAMNDKNPKKYWKFLNQLKPKTKDSPTPSLEEFYDYFKEINRNNVDDNRFNNEILTNQNSTESLNAKITQDEIKKCISKLQNGKAASPTDDILNEYIKSTQNLLLPFYCKLFNCVLDTGIIPSNWLVGTIKPIFKNKGDPKEPSNYRPITILSCLGKLFTSILNHRLTTFLEENNILDENQAGFRKGYSCADHIFALHALIEILKKRKQKLFCGFVDFSQAFDKVWRAGLWHKLLQNNINGNFFKVIHSMYNNIKSCISHNGSLSSPFLSEIGVRQGENLSPVLFSLFLNDLQTYMHINGCVGVELNDLDDVTLWLKLLILLYADDTIIVSNTADDFQKSLDIFNDYCKNWHLKVNINKTKVIVFGARQLRNFNFKLGTETLEITNKYHYLGVTFTSNGSFLSARKHVVEQASKAMHLLFTRANNADLPVDLIIKLFDHTVLPILTYGSEIFGFENLDIIEKVHSDFLRKITNARKSTPLNFLYGELGRYPISITIKYRMISFWTRLLTVKEQKLSFQIYKYMLNQTNTNFKWVNKIQEILGSVGRPDLWLNQAHINPGCYTSKLVKQILVDQFKQSWHEQLLQSNKGRSYLNFKEKHEFECYFKTLSRADHINLFKFRTANHSLPIETGRYDGTLLNERLCNLCGTGQIGSEEHYLLVCNYFSNERDRYIGNYLAHPHNLNFKSLISSSSISLLKQVSKFAKVIMDKFK
jgi:hypothetical protein